LVEAANRATGIGAADRDCNDGSPVRYCNAVDARFKSIMLERLEADTVR
jgi:hypothetical protein